MSELLVFPDLSGPESRSGFHIPRLLSEIDAIYGIKAKYIDAEKISHGPTKNQCCEGGVLFINWLDEFYWHYLPREVYLGLSVAPIKFQNIVADRILSSIKDTFRRWRDAGYLIAWYYHDYETFARAKAVSILDRKLRRFLYEFVDTIFYAEYSSKLVIENEFGPRDNAIVCPMGSFREFHGELPERSECASFFGISPERTVLLALGTRRKNRKVTRLVEAASKSDRVHLLVLGRGPRIRSGKNVTANCSYVSAEVVNAAIGLSDYFVNFGELHLTSAVSRTAISYHRPVISYCFGSDKDLCKGAAIEPTDDLIEMLYNLPPRLSPDYLELCHQAAFRDAERTWQLAGESLASLFR